MTEQQVIKQSILGKRIIAVAWFPVLQGEILSLESLTLEDGTVLKLRADDYWNAAAVKVEESEHANI